MATVGATSLVSVLIVTWNHAAYIQRCITSVRNQTYRPIEIVIADNGSTDGTVDRARELLDAEHIYALNSNTGYSGGSNFGLSKTVGDYVCCLNPDVELDPEFIELLVKVLDHDPSIAAACGKLFRALPNGRPVEPLTIDNAGGHVILASRAIRERGYEEIDRGQYDTAQDVFSCPGAAMLLRRTALDSVRHGGQVFDEDLFAYREEVDLFWRLREQGWRTRYVPQATGYHVKGWPVNSATWIADRKKISPVSRRLSYRNRYLLLIKNERVSALLRNLHHVLWYELKALAFVVLYERHLARTWPDILRLAPRFWRKRSCRSISLRGV